MKIGIIGCGNISPRYFEAGRRFHAIETAACADMLINKAKARANEFNIPTACSVDELLSNDDIELIINLTIPEAHAEISHAALESGKHVYNEKPLAAKRNDGENLLKLAASKNLRIGCAPDTFLGAGIQTAIKAMNDGLIGDPVAATAFFTCRGHERWHPDPEFYYQPGGGPLLDMGPYYLTALTAIIGNISHVTALTQTTFKERTITSEPKKGTKIPVKTPTHISGGFGFACGAMGTIMVSFDVWSAQLPFIEIYGTDGSMSVPNPNCFDGPVSIRHADSESWEDIPLQHIYSDQSRGIGVADMVHAIRSGRPHRCSGEMAFHVLDVMNSFNISAKEERHLHIQSSCDRPTPLPVGLTDGYIDD